MNVICRKIIAVGLFIVCIEAEAFCQLNLSRYEIGFSAGTFIYQGDLTPENLGSYKTLTSNFNLFVNRILNPSFTLRTNLALGKLNGDDSRYQTPEWRQQRNFKFSSSVVEFSELLVWNVTSTENRLSPYVFAGVGLNTIKVRRDWSNFNVTYFATEDLASRLKEDVDRLLPKAIAVLPVGVGLQYSLSKKFSLIGETTYRFTGTDYLDGFSKAGNPSLKDRYFSHTIGLVYKFGKPSNFDCPTNVR